MPAAQPPQAVPQVICHTPNHDAKVATAQDRLHDGDMPGLHPGRVEQYLDLPDAFTRSTSSASSSGKTSSIFLEIKRRPGEPTSTSLSGGRRSSRRPASRSFGPARSGRAACGFAFPSQAAVPTRRHVACGGSPTSLPLHLTRHADLGRSGSATSRKVRSKSEPLERRLQNLSRRTLKNLHTFLHTSGAISRVITGRSADSRGEAKAA